MHAAITAATGFLMAVLWFDLMFDVQLVGRRPGSSTSDDAVESIAAYYRRVTTDAAPMGRLVGVVMIVLLGLLVVQAARDRTPTWVTVVSLFGAVSSILLAMFRVVPAARRLGARTDPPARVSPVVREPSDVAATQPSTPVGGASPTMLTRSPDRVYG